MESSSNAEVYIDNDDFEEDKVIRFRQNTCDQSQNISNLK